MCWLTRGFSIVVLLGSIWNFAHAEVTKIKPTICLNMIVKNEEKVIKRALDSVKDRIDYWVIVDTGSCDATREIIRETLKDVPGELHERPWVDFGTNRTEALQFAKGKADYLLLMDADDWVEFSLRFQKEELLRDVYHVWWEHGSSFKYLKPFLIKSHLPWSYKGVIHEYLDCEKIYSEDTLNEVRYIYTLHGARSQDPDKYLKAAQILDEGLKKEPNNSRYVFYLAESYRDASEFNKAIAAYEKRAVMGGWEEEVFWSLFQIAVLKKQLLKPQEEVIESFYKAHRYRPHRIEPIYFLAELYNEQKAYALSYECIKGWLATHSLERSDRLFNLDWIGAYGLAFQLSICSYYIGKYQESLDLNDSLLAMTSLSDPIRKQAEFNRCFPLEKVLEKQGILIFEK